MEAHMAEEQRSTESSTLLRPAERCGVLPLKRWSMWRAAAMLLWVLGYGSVGTVFVELDDTNLNQVSCYLTPCFSITSVALPFEARRLAGAQASVWTSAATGSVVPALILVVFIVFLSDRATFRWGRRRPFILGATLSCVASMLLWVIGDRIDSMATIVVAYLILNVGQISGLILLRALIPDVLPPFQHGAASGIFSLFLNAGVAIGFALFGLGIPMWGCNVVFAVLSLLCFVPTAIFARERQFEQQKSRVSGGFFAGCYRGFVVGARSFSFSPRRHIDWTLLLALRFFFNAGAGANAYIIFWATDFLGIADAERMAGYVGLLTLAVGAVVSVPAGSLSDRFGSKPICAAGLALVVVATAVLGFVKSITAAWIAFLVFGAGFGIFASAASAMTYDTMPRVADAATFSAEGTFVAFAAAYGGPFFYGLLLDAFVLPQEPDNKLSCSLSSSSISGCSGERQQLYSDTGYTVLWCTASLFVALALVFSLILSPARGRRCQVQLGEDTPRSSERSELLSDDEGVVRQSAPAQAMSPPVGRLISE